MAILKPPKKKLKQFFRDLKADRKLMVAELKMICMEKRCKLIGKMEEVKPFDTVAAMRVHIKTLTSQAQLDRLDNAVKIKYSNVFSAIPHIDDLPTNVYC
jgi:hypothetical protein